MAQQQTLESIIDPFVKRVGGERVSEIVGNVNPESSADYLFRKHGVIAELKSLQAGTLVESFQRRMGNLMDRWRCQGRLIVMGTVRIDTSQLSPECQEEFYQLMAVPLQRQVVTKANQQIRSTKSLLNMPDARGLLWVASDGNEFLQPNMVWYLLQRILQKKKADRDPAYSSIDGIAYFNPRMLARAPGVPEPAIFFYRGYRRPDPALLACLGELSTEWPKYFAWAQGVPLRNVTAPVQDVRFFGVPEKLTQVRVNEKP